MLNLFKTIDLSAYSLCPQFTLKFMGLYGSISDFRLSKAYSYQRGRAIHRSDFRLAYTEGGMIDVSPRRLQRFFCGHIVNAEFESGKHLPRTNVMRELKWW